MFELVKVKMEKRMGSIRHRLKTFFQGSNPVEVLKPLADTIQSPIQKEILNRSLEETSGLEMPLRNPDALLEQKSETLRLYDTMILDDRIKFSIDLKKALVLHVPSHTQPASDEEKDKEIAQAFEDNLAGLKLPTWYDAQHNLLDGMVYGHKEGEIVWGQDEKTGRWVWEKLKFQHPIMFDFKYDEHKNLDYVAYGYYYGNDTQIPAEEFNNKFLYYVNPYLKDSNYYGDSDLREVYFDWWSKFKAKRNRNVFLQGYGMPIPEVNYVASEMNETELNEIDSMFQNWQESMYIKIPGKRNKESGEINPKFEINWVQLNIKTGDDPYSKTINSIDKSITRKLLLPDRLGFTEESSGSFAQSKKIFDILIIGIKELHTRLEAMMVGHVKRFVDFNFPNVEEYPVWKFDEIDQDMETEMLKTLLEKGVIDKREKWIRTQIGIPELSEKEQEEVDEAKEKDAEKQQEQFEKGGGNGQGGFPNNNGGSDNSNGNDGNGDKPNVNSNKISKKNEKLKENSSKVNFKQIEANFDTFEADFIRDYNEIMAEQDERIIRAVESKKIIENKDLKGLKKIKMVKSGLKRLFSLYYAKLYFTGKGDAINEVKSGVELQDGAYKLQDAEDLKWLSRDWIDRYLKKFGALGTLTVADKKYLTELRDKAFFITGQKEESVLKIVYNTIEEGNRSGLATKVIVSQIQTTLQEDRQAHALTIARTNASDAYNTGRMNTFTNPAIAPFVEAFMYDAIMDGQTTAFCREHNGQIIKADDPDFFRTNPPNHYNCRSIYVPITTGEGEEQGSEFFNYQDKRDVWGTGIEATVQPHKGFGG